MKLDAIKSPSLKKRGGSTAQLVIMAKNPELGRVKTRLGKDIGGVEATRFYRHNLTALLRRFRDEKRWDTSVAVGPDTSVNCFRTRFKCNAQGQGAGHLGKRMQAVFNQMPLGPVIIIGSDIPAISADQIAEAFDKLGQADMVLGSGEDGGYWLIGMKRTPTILQDVFQDVAWSTNHSFRDTMDNLKHYNVALLAPLNDIDDGSDYARWQQDGARY